MTTKSRESAPFRERARRCAERCFDLVEGLPSWDSMSDEKVRAARARVLDEVQGEIVGAMSQACRDAQAPALLEALRRLVDRYGPDPRDEMGEPITEVHEARALIRAATGGGDAS